MATKKEAPPKSKSLSRLRATDKGPIDHLRIFPAKNADGGQGFITHVHRKRPKAVEDQMAKTGRYMPEPEPEQVPHEDADGMLDHVASTFGVQRHEEPDGDEGEGENEEAA